MGGYVPSLHCYSRSTTGYVHLRLDVLIHYVAMTKDREWYINDIIQSNIYSLQTNLSIVLYECQKYIILRLYNS